MLCLILLSGSEVGAEPVAKVRLTTADTCGTCHRDIYRMWRTSAHAGSMEDPVFLESFRLTESEWSSEAARVCLGCHAPMTAVNGDWELREKVTWEGVSCDVCHSMVAVDVTHAVPRVTFEAGPVKRGPIREAASTAHAVAYSALHEAAEVCAPCHEYANADGTSIMSTYSEWTGSRAAEQGVTCQSCHMGATKAHVVDPRIQRSRHAEVNLHEVPGGHSRDQLYKALDIRYEPTRTEAALSLDLHIANRGAGHAVPTGMPGRQIVLEVEVDTGETDPVIERRVFGKRMLDSDGRPVTQTMGFFTPGVRVASDTRIPTDGEWTETLHYDIPASATAYVTVELHYEHVTAELARKVTSFTFYSERRILRPES